MVLLGSKERQHKDGAGVIKYAINVQATCPKRIFYLPPQVVVKVITRERRSDFICKYGQHRYRGSRNKVEEKQ